MVISKTELFNETLQKRANLFKTLAHPARLQILQYLVQTKSCLTGDISEHFPLSRATVNQHMKELKDAGLICGHLEGAKIVYCLNIENVREMEVNMTEFLAEIHFSADFCCAFKTLSTN